jgi:hypothetical protein
VKTEQTFEVTVFHRDRRPARFMFRALDHGDAVGIVLDWDERGLFGNDHDGWTLKRA